MREFSKEFQKLITSQNFPKLMEGSSSPGADYDTWERKRRFIADVIDAEGSILDIGCGNGFFLRSLQEWSTHSLMPYGIDYNAQYIKAAKAIFVAYPDHFAVLDVQDIATLSEHGLPVAYDFIYWNFLGAWKPSDPPWNAIVPRLLTMTHRRIILGFYGTNQYAPHSQEWEKERQRLLGRPQEFEALGITFSGKKANSSDFNQVIAWIDR